MRGGKGREKKQEGRGELEREEKGGRKSKREGESWRGRKREVEKAKWKVRRGKFFVEVREKCREKEEEKVINEAKGRKWWKREEGGKGKEKKGKGVK